MSGAIAEPECTVRGIMEVTDAWWMAVAVESRRLLAVGTYKPPVSEPGVVWLSLSREDARVMLAEMQQRAIDPPYTRQFEIRG